MLDQLNQKFETLKSDMKHDEILLTNLRFHNDQMRKESVVDKIKKEELIKQVHFFPPLLVAHFSTPTFPFHFH